MVTKFCLETKMKNRCLLIPFLKQRKNKIYLTNLITLLYNIKKLINKHLAVLLENLNINIFVMTFIANRIQQRYLIVCGAFPVHRLDCMLSFIKLLKWKFPISAVEYVINNFINFFSLSFLSVNDREKITHGLQKIAKHIALVNPDIQNLSIMKKILSMKENVFKSRKYFSYFKCVLLNLPFLKTCSSFQKIRNFSLVSDQVKPLDIQFHLEQLAYNIISRICRSYRILLFSTLQLYIYHEKEDFKVFKSMCNTFVRHNIYHGTRTSSVLKISFVYYMDLEDNYFYEHLLIL
uniref:Uncharacterized protein n=1 Tax=Heterorhabditis bacteriophora TaxID=37862 RepID=A0A1I7WJN4_HETBA